MPKYRILDGTKAYKNIFRFALGATVISGFFTIGALYVNMNFSLNIVTRLCFDGHYPTRQERLDKLRDERDAFFSEMSSEPSKYEDSSGHVGFSSLRS